MTVTPIRAVPLASVQGTLALDLSPRHQPPPAPAPRPLRATGPLEAWVHRFAQATVEIVGGDRPPAQLVRWSSRQVYEDLHRRAVVVARAGGHAPGVARVQPVRPQVVSVHTSTVRPGVAEASARVRYGDRSRALALRFEHRAGRWLCTALEFA